MSTYLSLPYVAAHFILAILLCFWGYKYLRATISVYGFLLGVLISFYFVVPLGWSPLLNILLIVAVGFLLGAIVYALYSVTLFFAGMAIGANIGFFLSILLGLQTFEAASLIIVLVLSIACGVLAVIFKRTVFIVSTAIIGGINIALYGGYLVYGLQAGGFSFFDKLTDVQVMHADMAYLFKQYAVVVVILSVVCICLGLLVQLRSKKSPKK